jgi:AP-1-like transcription factor
MASSDSQYYLSPTQQDLLAAALSSNQPSSLARVAEKDKGNQVSANGNGHQDSTRDYVDPSPQTRAIPGQVAKADDSPYLGFDLDADGDDQFEFDSNAQFIGDFPGDASQVDSSEHHEKRKSVDDKDEDDEGGGKRRESEGGTGKKPGRKPLIAEPTTVSCASLLPGNG